MAHVPTEAEIDAMSEEELEAYLSQEATTQAVQESAYAREDSAAARGGLHTVTGAPRGYGIGTLVGSLIAIAASWELMLSELQQLREPMAELNCDINPLVSCGASLNVWQGNLLGVPNSFIGAMAFAVLAATGALLATGNKLPRWYWLAMTAGMSGAMAWVLWFLYQSLFELDKLCPYCMVIWAVTIPMFTHTLAQAAMGGHLSLDKPTARRLLAARWWIAGAIYVLIVGAILIRFWDQWMAII